MVDEQGPPQLTPESEKALQAKVKELTDQIIENDLIPKKVPRVEDIDEQTKAVGAALANALTTATEIPIHALKPVVGDLAAQLVALGIRQTKHIDPEAVHAPTWITDGVRQHSVRLPDPPKHTEGEPVVARTAVAPQLPKRIAKAARAVRR